MAAYVEDGEVQQACISLVRNVPLKTLCHNQRAPFEMDADKCSRMFDVIVLGTAHANMSLQVLILRQYQLFYSSSSSSSSAPRTESVTESNNTDGDSDDGGGGGGDGDDDILSYAGAGDGSSSSLLLPKQATDARRKKKYGRGHAVRKLSPMVAQRAYTASDDPPQNNFVFR